VAEDGKAAVTEFAVAINPSAQLPRITHKVYLNVEFGSKGGKKGRWAFSGTSCPGQWGFFLHFALTADAAMPGFFLCWFDILQR
jgi:hypothetical protein